MHWFSSPKVRLAIIVNGLYFISLFTPTTQHSRPRLFSREYREYGNLEVREVSKRQPVYASLPPPSGPSKAATWVNKDFNQLDVYLTNDLTLVNRSGYRLLLSPAFTTRANNPEAPDTVLLRFVSYSNTWTYSDTNWLTITADGRYMWREDLSSRYSKNPVPQSDTEGEGGGIVRTAGINLPYELFIETISARQVIIQFGPDRVELTAEQIEALRDMHRRLPQPPPPDDAPAPVITNELNPPPPPRRSSGVGVRPKP
jgi:hypothetical protein